MGNVLDIERITVRADRVVLEVKLATGVPAYTTPVIAQKLLHAAPSLKDHMCANSKGNTLLSVLDHTSIPHVFEHLVIDCQVRAACQSKEYDNRTFVGTTEWTNEGAGQARIELRYYDDIKVLEAINRAMELLNETIGV